MKPAIAIILTMIFTAGCSDLARQTIAAKGAAAYDQALEDAEWVMCHAASVGSVQRRYGQSAETAADYNGICKRGSKADIISGPPE